MDGKLLARSVAAVFVGIACAMTLVQLREAPTSPAEKRPVAAASGSDRSSSRLRACARLGEAALSDADCLDAWAEKRRRFFDADHPEDFPERVVEGAPPTSVSRVTPGTGSD